VVCSSGLAIKFQLLMETREREELLRVIKQKTLSRYHKGRSKRDSWSLVCTLCTYVVLCASVYRDLIRKEWVPRTN